MEVICPYCGKNAELADSAEIYHGQHYGMIWLCRSCDAYVGTHKNGRHTPLGTLANGELRKWRKRAHSLFDTLWKKKGMKRQDAYKIMQKLMEMSKREAHIAKFSVEQCKQLIELLKVAGNARE